MDWELFWTASGALGAILAGLIGVAIFVIELLRYLRESRPRFEVDLTQLATGGHDLVVRLRVQNINASTARLASFAVQKPPGFKLRWHDAMDAFIPPQDQMFWDLAVIPPSNVSGALDLTFAVTLEVRSARVSSVSFEIRRTINVRPMDAKE